ncbi:MAG: ribonuclease III [Phycisphaerales bacterium]
MTEADIEAIEDALEYEFEDRDLLKRALTHASLVDCRTDSNERLEFLGDAVLGMVVCEHLYRTYPEHLEGDMTKVKSTVVSRQNCAVVADRMGLADHLRIGKGMCNRKKLPSSVLAAVFESIIGAIYLDGGLGAAEGFILDHLEEIAERAASSGHQSNFKSVLQQAAQQYFELTPHYTVLDEKGPDHAKCFEVCVDLGPHRFHSCWGASKKQAEQEAALQALMELGLAERDAKDYVHLIEPPDELDIDALVAHSRATAGGRLV